MSMCVCVCDYVCVLLSLTPPIVTPLDPWNGPKLFPIIVKVKPPDLSPNVGEKLVIIGAA